MPAEKPLSFQALILKLHDYWSRQGCVILQPHDVEVGAGTLHPATVLRALGPRPWRAAKSARNAVRKLRSLKDKKEAETLFTTVAGMLDKLAKKNIIHKNKAGNLKSGLQVHINGL
jgi:hypothetical protein